MIYIDKESLRQIIFEEIQQFVGFGLANNVSTSNAIKSHCLGIIRQLNELGYLDPNCYYDVEIKLSSDPTQSFFSLIELKKDLIK